MKSIPVIGEKEKKLDAIPGRVPSLDLLPSGCRFEKRCTEKNVHITSDCQKRIPPIFNLNNNHGSRCWLKREHNEKIS